MKDSGITERNKEKVRYLMNLSFEMRRNEIVKEPQPLEELLQKFPFLKHPEEVHMHVIINTQLTTCKSKAKDYPREVAEPKVPQRPQYH